ncbi:MAG TPA: YkvA family protein [Rhodanobacteraceae bacterium]|nr:YkvA family protein [Rhodanobacteraceae bacterium]
MRITFELEPADIERFQAALGRARAAARCAGELDVIDAAKYALDHLCAGDAPSYVRKRLSQVQSLILMLEDEDWALSDPERTDVVETLLYFGDPDDLIPDHIEVIGLLDDAIMLELLVRRVRHVLGAYANFCAFRSALDAGSGTRQLRARSLAAKRVELQLRMRNRRKRHIGARS